MTFGGQQRNTSGKGGAEVGGRRGKATRNGEGRGGRREDGGAGVCREGSGSRHRPICCLLGRRRRPVRLAVTVILLAFPHHLG